MNTTGTIHALFESQVSKHPDLVAIESEQGSLSYSELNKKANQLAHYLRKHAIPLDTPIAICLERSQAFFISILAILKTGCAYLPIDFSHPEERLRFILQDSNAPILITDTQFNNKFKQYRGSILCIDDEPQIDQQPIINPNLDVSSNNLAYVIYTSGSTGTPKGVLIEHASVINYSLWYGDFSYCHPGQRVDFSSNPNFDMAITTSITPLILGLVVVICPESVKKDLRLFLQYLNSQRIDSIKLTPSYFKVLLKEVSNNFINLPHLKTILLGGELLMAAECCTWLALYPNHLLINEYGPTEATVGITLFKITHEHMQNLIDKIPIGYCGDNIYCYILDADKNILPDGELGELYIGGACLARGYLNRPELNQEYFIADPFSKDHKARLYKTGDLCRRYADGLFEYIGRIDNQVKIRGFRVEPEEIEKHLIKHPSLATVVVAAQPYDNEKRLIAYFITKENKKAPTKLELSEFLNKYVPNYMIPKSFLEINALPLTANGKLDIAALPIPEITASQHFIAPMTDLEKAIAAIWSKELHVKTIGLEDNFFELGGHSLSAARIVSEINAQFKKDIGIRDFYQATNIAKFIPLMQDLKPIEVEQHPSIDINEKDIPLSEFQFMLWMLNTFEPETQKLNIIARKRFKDRLNIKALKFALDAVIKKQEVLNYQILKIRPIQQLQRQSLLHFYEENITDLSIQQSEQLLEESMHQLSLFHPWPKDSPLFLVRLFYLNNSISELQICMSHMISDDVSPDILLADLSRYYLSHENSIAIEQVKPDPRYKKYIQEEQNYYQKNLERDTIFWEEYLKDTHLFVFPANYIVNNMKAQESAYSTYAEIPEQGLINLKHFCAQHHISVNDGLCAAMAFVLKKYITNQQNIFMNRVKSTRENQNYDKTIGCFLRLEPIKISIHKQSTLAHLSQQIHQSSIETSPYQRCPGLVKLTSTQTFRKNHSKVKNFLVNISSNLYAFLFKVPSVYRKIFNQCSGPLISFDRNHHYLININVHTNFIESSNKYNNLFGLDTIEVPQSQKDLLNIDNFFDVCFMRSDAQNRPYLVISANLQPGFRELVAKEVIETLTDTA